MTAHRLIALGLLVVLFRSSALGAPERASCEEAAMQIITAIQKADIPAMSRLSEELQADLVTWARAYPDSFPIRFATGFSLMFTENIPDSLPHLAAAYRQSNFAPMVGFQYSVALKKDQRPLEALRVSKEVAEKNPEIQQLQFAYALNSMEVQQYEAAVALLTPMRRDDATPPDQDYGAILRTLGKCQLYLGMHSDAVATLEESLRFAPEQVRTREFLAEALLKQGKVAEAKRVLHATFGEQNTTPRELYLTGLILDIEEIGSSKEYYQRALKEGLAAMVEVSGEEQYLIGQIAARLGHAPLREKHFEAAADLEYHTDAPWADGVAAP